MGGARPLPAPPSLRPCESWSCVRPGPARGCMHVRIAVISCCPGSSQVEHHFPLDCCCSPGGLGSSINRLSGARVPCVIFFNGIFLARGPVFLHPRHHHCFHCGVKLLLSSHGECQNCVFFYRGCNHAQI